MKRISTLKKNYEFKNVLKKGNFYKGKYIIIYINKNTEEKNKIGIAISKKLAKANKRNRIKRLVRESYQSQKDNIKKGYNIVFIWNKHADIINNTYKDINEDIIKLFNKAGILDENNNDLFNKNI